MYNFPCEIYQKIILYLNFTTAQTFLSTFNLHNSLLSYHDPTETTVTILAKLNIQVVSKHPNFNPQQMWIKYMKLIATYVGPFVFDHHDIHFINLLLQNHKIDPTIDNNYAIEKASQNDHLLVVELLLKDPRVESILTIMRLNALQTMKSIEKWISLNG